MQISERGLEYQEVLWLLGSVCSLYRLPFDPKLIEQSFPPPQSLATFYEAARALGFKTGHGQHPADWQKLPLPAIAFLCTVPEAGAELLTSIPVLILKTDGHKLLYFRTGSLTPETITVEVAATQFEPQLILASREASGTNSDGEIPGFKAETKEFGFAWFVPELLKHKTIWRDVLLASLRHRFGCHTQPDRLGADQLPVGRGRYGGAGQDRSDSHPQWMARHRLVPTIGEIRPLCGK